jgi:hypothetical protein
LLSGPVAFFRRRRKEKRRDILAVRWLHCSVLSGLAIFFILFIWQNRPSGLFLFRTILKLWILQTVGRTPCTGDQPVTKPLPTQDNTNSECLHRGDIPRVGF